MWTLWIYTRDFCFPIIIGYGVFHYPRFIPSWAETGELKIMFTFGVFCSFLQILNVWWSYRISQIVFKFTKTGKAEDTINKIE